WSMRSLCRLRVRPALFLRCQNVCAVFFFTANDRRDEAVAALGESLNKPCIAGGIAQSLAQFVYRSVQTVIEINENLVWPESGAQFLASDQLSGPLQEQR